MKSQEELQNAADRAFELLEQKSPHQLAVELAQLQRKHGIAVSALNKIGAQRDQLAFQFKDATAQCGVMADLLRDAFAYIDDDQDHSIETGKPLPDNCVSLLSRIDAALAGKMPTPGVPEGWQPVPVEPTMAMISAATAATTGFGTRAQWDAMLAAAPKPEGGA